MKERFLTREGAGGGGAKKEHRIKESFSAEILS